MKLKDKTSRIAGRESREYLDQLASTTGLNRYPSLFRFASKEASDARRVLSFGCATGEEVVSIRSYFSTADVIGFDLKSEAIEIAKDQDPDFKSNYFDKLPELKNTDKFDVIFCCSVLCSFPAWDEYKYTKYLDSLSVIDSLLKEGGLLIIYNSSYRFSDTDLFKEKYTVVKTGIKSNLHCGYVPIRNKKGIVFKDQASYRLGPVAFRKVSV